MHQQGIAAGKKLFALRNGHTQPKLLRLAVQTIDRSESSFPIHGPAHNTNRPAE